MPAPIAAIGTVLVVRGVKLVAVPLYRIVRPVVTELSHVRIAQLKNGFNSLDDILSNPHWRGDPITLTRVGGMFKITDGRHRVTLALERVKTGIGYVWARILD